MTSQHDRFNPSRVILSGLAAWVITLVVASAAWISIVAYRGTRAAHEPLIELALLYPFIMALPFAFVIACVTVPTVVGVRSLIGERRLWLGLAGAASAPLAAVVLVVAGRLLFAGNRPPLWANLMAAARDPQGLLPVLLALIVGGIALGLGIGRRAARTAV